MSYVRSIPQYLSLHSSLALTSIGLQQGTSQHLPLLIQVYQPSNSVPYQDRQLLPKAAGPVPHFLKSSAGLSQEGENASNPFQNSLLEVSCTSHIKSTSTTLILRYLGSGIQTQRFRSQLWDAWC